MKGFDDHLDNYGDPGGYYGQAGTRNPEEPASAAYMPVSGLTNDGLGRMTPDYSMVNQASVWGPTRLDPFPPGVPAADITALLAYNWRDEEVDYYNVLASQDISAEELNKTHIFAAMNRINEWITRG